MCQQSEAVSNLQAVWEARTTGSSCPGNCFLATDWKQPIYLREEKKRTARLVPVLHYNIIKTILTLQITNPNPNTNMQQNQLKYRKK